MFLLRCLPLPTQHTFTFVIFSTTVFLSVPLVVILRVTFYHHITFYTYAGCPGILFYIPPPALFIAADAFTLKPSGIGLALRTPILVPLRLPYLPAFGPYHRAVLFLPPLHFARATTWLTC